MSRVMARVAGAYEHPARAIPDKTLEQVHLEIAQGALADAGPPRSHCPACLTPSTRSKTLSNAGTVYSFSVVHRGDPAFSQATPYVLAYVTIDDGPTIMGNVVGVPPADVHVGMRVTLRSPGPATPGTGGAQFVPAG